MRSIFALVMICGCLFPLMAAGWKSQGEIAYEARGFTDDHIDSTEDWNQGVFARLDTSWRKGPWRMSLRGFGRVDSEDDSRNIAALEEAWVGFRKRGWEAILGFQMVNWTATEAFHPADVVNSRNLDSDLERPEKLGELMLSVRRRIADGGLTLYYLPRFEEPRLPEASNRLSFAPPGTSIGDALWLDDDGSLSGSNSGSQWGFRFTQTLGDADISVHYLDHMDRLNPAFQLDFLAGEVVPVYQRVEDFGATWLQIFGALIVKVEYAYKDFADQTGALAALQQVDHQAGAFGFEYSWTGGAGWETTLLLEGQSILDTSEEERYALSAFQRDILVGWRHSWNDVMGRQLLATFIFDTERSNEYLFNASYEQRLSDTWKIRGGVRYIDAAPKDVFPIGLENLDEDNQVFLTVSRFF